MKRLLFFLILSISIILRIYHFGINPPSLYWDEASLGYNAYSITDSLKDEHGEFLPLDRFIAFGDYKPPGYIYAAALWVRLFGLNEFSVRFPSFLAGIFMVIVTYFLVKELFQKEKIALFSMFIIGISPWAVHFSRAAFEANLAAFFNLLGIYFFIRSGKNKSLIILSVLSFIFSFYTFNANRIIAPLLVITLGIIYFRNILVNKKWTLFTVIAGLLLLMPSIGFLKSSDSKLRFQEVSIFNNLEPLEKSNMMIQDDGGNIFAKIMHNRRVIFAADYLKHYSDNFSLRFLFTDGDINPRLSVQGMGQLYFIELPFFILGIYFLFKKRKKESLVLFLWMLIAVIPAGVARETPHALRIISILPTYQIIIALGLFETVNYIKVMNKFNKSFLFFVICFLFITNIYFYLHIYYSHYPYKWSGEWQYGYKQMVSYVLNNGNKYDNILVTNALGRPYIYFAYYKPYTSEEFQHEAVITRDAFGFYDVKKLGKISFEWNNITQYTGRLLLVTTDKNLSSEFRLLDVIKNLNGDPVFYIGEKI